MVSWPWQVRPLQMAQAAASSSRGEDDRGCVCAAFPHTEMTDATGSWLGVAAIAGASTEKASATISTIAATNRWGCLGERTITGMTRSPMNS